MVAVRRHRTLFRAGVALSMAVLFGRVLVLDLLHVDPAAKQERHQLVVGISEAVAESIVDLGIDWGGIETLADLQTGLRAALHSMGIKLAKM